MLSKAINDYIESLREYMKNGINVENLREIINTTPSIPWYNTGKNFHYLSGNITFEDISFSYWNKKILEKCSFHLPWGKKIALVWHSGGGKTTIAKLITGYLHPLSGQIIIDKQCISPWKETDKVSLKSYYKHIGYLTQEPSVFDGTIEENLTFGINEWYRWDKDFNKHLEDIITKSQCQFIYDLPNKLQTQIGEKWVKLSGGQKQRLAIARIFLKDPKIVILDEPTSALDSVSEYEITKAMDNLFVDRTVIVIAHRLQTVKNADIIMMIEDGKILAQGTHDELLTKNKNYQELVSLQSGW